MKPVVVKLGGSTAGAAATGMWADALSKATLPLVIVPGGGPFADQVRLAQPQMGFSDVAAHAMAILAMEQFAQIILDGRPRLAAACTVEQMQQAHDAGRIPVWMPTTLALAADIRPSWDITSDSLAAWLAGRLDASALVLVKQSGDFSEQDTVESLSRRGIVDAALADMLPQGVALRLAGPSAMANAAAALAAGSPVGVPIRPAATAVRRGG
ncbi:MAG: dihydroneopterin aldolase [Mesorhizobium sp.]